MGFDSGLIAMVSRAARLEGVFSRPQDQGLKIRRGVLPHDHSPIPAPDKNVRNSKTNSSAENAPGFTLIMVGALSPSL